MPVINSCRIFIFVILPACAGGCATKAVKNLGIERIQLGKPIKVLITEDSSVYVYATGATEPSQEPQFDAAIIFPGEYIESLLERKLHDGATEEMPSLVLRYSVADITLVRKDSWVDNSNIPIPTELREAKIHAWPEQEETQWINYQTSQAISVELRGRECNLSFASGMQHLDFRPMSYKAASVILYVPAVAVDVAATPAYVVGAWMALNTIYGDTWK